mmetsp:Transcript_31040/g.62984  ORF Transcript_31040/g.62984 Transcript_31040/m.62984 type:complete len:206 (-) Transcript_31040:290-907(-)
MDTFKEPEYKNRVVVQAAATVCLAVGCSRVDEAVLDTLADVVKEYVKTIGTHANNIAEAGGRTVCTPLDALSALKQMGPKEVSIVELRRFEKSWQQPFHAEVPQLPVKKRKRFNRGANESSSGWGAQEIDRPPHIPAFLPPFPPKHTYQATEAGGGRRSKDVKAAQQARLKRRNAVTEALTSAASAAAPFPSPSSSGIPFSVKPL